MPSLSVETRSILRAHGLHPKKALGQTFLIDREALQSVVRAAEVRPGDLVLEIGPGVGTLTTELADQGAEVVAVELDERLADVLAERTAHERHVRVVRGNALHLDLAPLLPAGEPFKLVANIPYYITAPILRHFLEGPWRPALIVLMVQKEVAERLAAQPGDMSRLGVMAQFYARVEIVRVVPASSFLPAPQVDSAIVRLRRHEMPPVTVDNVDRFFKVVKAGFGEKRKQLHNALVRGLAHIPATQIDAALEQAGIDRTRRAETLRLEEWGRLYQAIGAQPAAQRKQPSPSRTQRAPLPDRPRGENSPPPSRGEGAAGVRGKDSQCS
jgi:16S rRNA (adenine1518-N6/adenine1519-N6)-dimethyltransferase